MLFFEQPVERRDFIKRCTLTLLAAGTLGPKLVKFCESQVFDLKRGYAKRQPALYYKKLAKKKVQCELCPRRCIVSGGSRGFCRVRENRKGEYFTLAHSNPCAVHIDPIEKKPLFHFLPGTTALSLATAGCNFTCKNCQNWDISQSRPDDTDNLKIAPQAMVDLAVQYAAPTIAYTYTEPTVFYEYMLEIAKIARGKGLLNIYHSNGYIQQPPLDELCVYLDGANVDLKGFSEEFYEEISAGTLEPVLNTLKTLKSNGVWLEITNLIIPTKNDSEEMIKDLCQWIADELGEDTPLHFSRFYPQYKLENISPTPIETLKKAHKIAREQGLNYVYLGNVPDAPEGNTYCPKCGKAIIERKGYSVLQNHVKAEKCGFCGHPIAGRWV